MYCFLICMILQKLSLWLMCLSPITYTLYLLENSRSAFWKMSWISQHCIRIRRIENTKLGLRAHCIDKILLYNRADRQTCTNNKRGNTSVLCTSYPEWNLPMSDQALMRVSAENDMNGFCIFVHLTCACNSQTVAEWMFMGAASIWINWIQPTWLQLPMHFKRISWRIATSWHFPLVIHKSQLL